MLKTFETLYVEVRKFDGTDVLTTSGEEEILPEIAGESCTGLSC